MLTNLTALNSSILMDVAAIVGTKRIADFVEGKPLYTPSERVRRLEIDDTCNWVNELALPSDDGVEDEHHAQAAQLQLGEIIPMLQLAIREANTDKIKESIVGMLDAALEAHRELGSFISRPGEFTHSRAHECLSEFLGLAQMAQTLIDSVVPSQEGPDVGSDSTHFDFDVGPESKHQT